MQLPQAERYAAAYGILRGYVETLLVNFAEVWSSEQTGEIRIVLDQLAKVTGEDYHLDLETRKKLDQLARTLREGDKEWWQESPREFADGFTETSDVVHIEYTLYFHPSETYTARLAYGYGVVSTPLWGSERLEVWHEGRWIAGKVGHLHAGGGLVLFPHGENYLEYITLTVGSRVRNVSKPHGDGGGPEQ
jgi:hypothetical protein